MRLLELLRKGLGFLLMSMGVSSPDKKAVSSKPETKSRP
jgi:hypothetical protein